VIAFGYALRVFAGAVVVALMLTGRDAELAFGLSCAAAAAAVRLSGAA